MEPSVVTESPLAGDQFVRSVDRSSLIVTPVMTGQESVSAPPLKLADICREPSCCWRALLNPSRAAGGSFASADASLMIWSARLHASRAALGWRSASIAASRLHPPMFPE